MAADTEERQLRAYVGITGDIQLNCRSCGMDVFRKFTPSPNHITDDRITVQIRNGGRTPAYDVYGENGYYSVEYEGRLPENFSFSIYPSTQHFAGISPEIQKGIGILNARDTDSFFQPLPQDVIALIVQAKHHQISLFMYGNIYYADVFQKRRCTPFCVAYLPDFPPDQQFTQCEQHNTPPKDC